MNKTIITIAIVFTIISGGIWWIYSSHANMIKPALIIHECNKELEECKTKYKEVVKKSYRKYKDFVKTTKEAIEEVDDE